MYAQYNFYHYYNYFFIETIVLYTYTVWLCKYAYSREWKYLHC